MAHTNCLYKTGFVNMVLALSCTLYSFIHCIIYWLTPGRKQICAFPSREYIHTHHHSSTQKGQNTRGEVWQLNQLNSKMSSFVNQYRQQINYLEAYTENYCYRGGLLLQCLWMLQLSMSPPKSSLGRKKSPAHPPVTVSRLNENAVL